VSYEVCVTAKARRQLDDAATWWSKHRSAEQAYRWYSGFIAAINSLSDHPESKPFARENEALPIELQELRYGLGRKPTHRALFPIRPDAVVVHAVRHLAQTDLTFEDL
jgi:plasmid stabilization system protein ParE